MKKTKIILGGAMLFLFFCFACHKEAKHFSCHKESNYIEKCMGNTKTTQNYTIVVDLGHEAKNCRGCILYNGEMIHIDCQGNGNACRVSSNVSLYSSGNSAYIVTTDTFGLTDQDFFNMPSRSLFVEYDEKNNEVWLNIPAQLVFRDSSTLQFTFTGLYYSNAQVFENE